MFKELAPYLRQRAVLLTVTSIEEDQIRMNVIPQKLKDGENAALTTPLTVTGTAEELDRDLPGTLVDFVSAHMQLKNTLDRAKAEMDAAAKTAQAEARSKTKAPAKKEPPKPETGAQEIPKSAQPVKLEPPKTASLFDAPASATSAATADVEDNEEILGALEEDDQIDEDVELDEAA
ncbi:MAG TPA: PRTRC system protein E [Terracidiphilus sp.]|jgi:PRTRC genetic system protein E